MSSASITSKADGRDQSKDLRYFKEVKRLRLKTAKIVAFSSTIKHNVRPEEDDIMKAVLEADTGWVTIVGKSWDLHVGMR